MDTMDTTKPEMLSPQFAKDIKLRMAHSAKKHPSKGNRKPIELNTLS